MHGCGGWSRALLLLSGSFGQLERQFLGGRCGAVEALTSSLNNMAYLGSCLESKVTQTEHVECISWRHISLVLESFFTFSLAARSARCSIHMQPPPGDAQTTRVLTRHEPQCILRSGTPSLHRAACSRGIWWKIIWTDESEYDIAL